MGRMAVSGSAARRSAAQGLAATATSRPRLRHSASTGRLMQTSPTQLGRRIIRRGAMAVLACMIRVQEYDNRTALQNRAVLSSG